MRQNNTTGKSPKICPALRVKIFPLPRRANQKSNSRHPVPPEGRWPSSQTRGRERWTRRLRLTSVATSVRRNRLGPTPRCWRQVLAGLTLLADDGGKKDGHQDDHVYAVK